MIFHVVSPGGDPTHWTLPGGSWRLKAGATQLLLLYYKGRARRGPKDATPFASRLGDEATAAGGATAATEATEGTAMSPKELAPGNGEETTAYWPRHDHQVETDSRCVVQQ